MSPGVSRVDWDDDSAIDGLAVAAIDDLVRDHPGTIVHQRWQPVSLLLRAFELNGHELLDLVDRAESNQELAFEVMQNVRPPTDIKFVFYATLTQRVLNFTATTSALVEATRIAIRQYDGDSSDLAAQYEQRKAQMLRERVVKLVNKGLRNYLLHYARTPVGLQMRSEGEDGDPFKFTVVLSPDALLQFDGLDADTRTYLRAQEEPLSLRATVLEYDAAIRSLYSWLNCKTERLHGPAVEQANRWISRMHQGRLENE